MSTINNKQLDHDSETLRFTKNIAVDWKGSYTLCMSLISMINTAIPIMLINATIIPVLARLYTNPHLSQHGGKSSIRVKNKLSENRYIIKFEFTYLKK